MEYVPAAYVCFVKSVINTRTIKRFFTAKGRRDCPLRPFLVFGEAFFLTYKHTLVIDNPVLMAEWDTEENCKKGLFPDKLRCGSGLDASWICHVGHHYSARIAHRNAGHGCPYCSGRKAIPRETDLETLYPQIANEWDYKANGILIPQNVRPGSNIVVSWRCNRGHTYSASIVSRIGGRGCPYCANKIVLKGFNDLETTDPELAKEWDYERNTILPTEVTFGSGKRIFWKCSEKHSYPATVSERRRGRGCPYCSNKKVLVGYNDLRTRFPKIAAEWNYEKNGDLKPEMYVYGSGASVWWKCIKGHEWKVPIVSRTRDGNGCKICNNAKSSSFYEKALYYYIKKQFPNAESNYKTKLLKKRELDVFLPDYNIGLEYDGDIWHRDASRDIEKNEMCKSAGITLIRIREPECPPLNGQSIDYQMKNHSTWEYEEGIKFAIQTIQNLTKVKGIFDVSIDRDFSDISQLIEHEEATNSLAAVNPALASEWHPTKNQGLLPTQIAANSGAKVWWKGLCGHEWTAVVASRNAGKCGCPVCRGLRVLAGFNDLESQYPSIASEWDYQKNEALLPSEVTPGSSKNVWWKCQKGHSYSCRVVSRTAKKCGCPYCSNQRLLVGYNDLQTTHPKLASEWLYEKNGELKPTDVFAGSSRKVWWKCKTCGREWEAYISNRSRGSGCSHCSHKPKKL